MKKLTLLFILIAFSAILSSQVPKSFKYQAVLRDITGNLIISRSVGLRIHIIKDNIFGSSVYTESFSVQTNQFGLVNLNIGNGTPVLNSFSDIDWSNGLYFLKIEIDPNGGTNYASFGDPVQLVSVPFALYADRAGNGFSGNYADLTNKPTLFDGSWTSLTAKPNLFNGSYIDLTNKPQLFSGAYIDLTGKPILWDSTWSSIKNKPTLFDGKYSSLAGAPILSTIATSGNYNDLSNRPNIFNGSYTALTNKPRLSVSLTGDTLSLGPDNFTIIPGISNTLLTPEYKSVLASMTLKPSAADQIAQNAWISELINLGVFKKAIVLDNFSCGDQQSSLINWRSPGTYNPSAFNSPAFTAYKGFKGTGTNRIRSNFIPSVNGAGFLSKDSITIVIGINDETDYGTDDFGCVGDSTDIDFYAKNGNRSYVALNGLPVVSFQTLTSKRYFTLSRNTSTTVQLYKDLAQVTKLSPSKGLCDHELWTCGSNLYSGNRTISFVLIFKYLNEPEVQGVIETCDRYLSNYHNNIRTYSTKMYFNLVTEGHSFIDPSPGLFLADYIVGKINTRKVYHSGVSGSVIANCVSRAATVDSKLITETATYKNILVLWIGVNEITNTIGSGTAAYSALKSYVIARVNAGWKIFVYTMVPSTFSGRNNLFEAERNTYNDLIRNDLTLINGVYALNTDTTTELSDCSNLIYFQPDALHPTAAGESVASELFANKMAIIFP